MFTNREEAGRLLGERLADLPLIDPVVLGIPRGGVVVAAAIANEIDADVDVVIARKLRAPFYSEFAIGAVDEDGDIVRNTEGLDAFSIPEKYLQEETERQLQEIAERKALYRAHRPAVPLKGRSVILTDDGIATGSTMIAALQVVRKKQAHEIILAVPVSSPDRLAEVGKLADQSICLLSPTDFRAVGMYYDDFHPVEDDEVLSCLDAVPSAR